MLFLWHKKSPGRFFEGTEKVFLKTGDKKRSRNCNFCSFFGILKVSSERLLDVSPTAENPTQFLFGTV